MVTSDSPEIHLDVTAPGQPFNEHHWAVHDEDRLHPVMINGVHYCAFVIVFHLMDKKPTEKVNIFADVGARLVGVADGHPVPNNDLLVSLARQAIVVYLIKIRAWPYEVHDIQ